jgi:hypothetical protein
MTIAQMHILIEQKLQNLNAFVNDNFLPDEIDLFINEMQEAFIKQRFSPDSNPKRKGFEASNKRLADLQSLLKEVTLLPVVDNTEPEERKYFIASAAAVAVTSMAADNLYQIVTIGNTTFTAVGAVRGEVGEVFIASGAGTGTGTVAPFDFFFPVSSRVNLIVNAKPLVIDKLPTRYLGMVKSTYNPASPAPARGDFYIASETATYTSFSGVAATKGCVLYYNGTTRSIQSLPAFNYPKIGVPIRIVEHEEKDRMLQNPFGKPTERSPIATVRGNFLMVPVSERFILKDVSLQYLRKPKPVSLSSSSNCELPDHTHSEIVDLVVNHILEVIESKRYQSSSLEALKNE